MINLNRKPSPPGIQYSVEKPMEFIKSNYKFPTGKKNIAAHAAKAKGRPGGLYGTSAKKNLRPYAGVHLVRHVRQVNPTALCRNPHPSHVPYRVQCVSNHAIRQEH